MSIWMEEGRRVDDLQAERRVRRRMDVRECGYCKEVGHSMRFCPERNLYTFWTRCHALKQSFLMDDGEERQPFLAQHHVNLLLMLDRYTDLLAAREFAVRFCGETNEPSTARAFNHLSAVAFYVLEHEDTDLSETDLLPKIDCFGPEIPFQEISFCHTMKNLLHSSVHLEARQREWKMLFVAGGRQSEG